MINATIVGQLLFILDVIFIFLTIYYGRKDTRTLPLTILYAVLLNCLLPPLGWYYCYNVYKKHQVLLGPEVPNNQ